MSENQDECQRCGAALEHGEEWTARSAVRGPTTDATGREVPVCLACAVYVREHEKEARRR